MPLTILLNSLPIILQVILITTFFYSCVWALGRIFRTWARGWERRALERMQQKPRLMVKAKLGKDCVEGRVVMIDFTERKISIQCGEIQTVLVVKVKDICGCWSEGEEKHNDATTAGHLVAV